MRQSRTKTEQLMNDDIVIDYDQPLTTNEIAHVLCNLLGDSSSITKIDNKKVVIYKHDNISECLLLKSITYLGNPHHIFKKRIQLDSSINDFYEKHKYDGYNIRLIGCYHYEDTIIFTDFDKTKYLERKLNNSSAHVMINDLYQALSNGVFTKIDFFGNKITTINKNNIKTYFDQTHISYNEIINLINEFNDNQKFGDWIKADESIIEMKNHKWYGYKEAEWPGFYLEFLYSNFINDNGLNNIMSFQGNIKDKNKPDFDLFINKYNFYADLKSSDITKKMCPANDQTNFINAINEYGKFWYIIYEHETIKDIVMNSEMAIKRMNIIGKNYSIGDDISYKNRMKHSINYKRMFIIELNKINYKEILSDFNQGHQYQSDVKRSVKFMIDKRNINNFLIYSYNFKKND